MPCYEREPEWCEASRNDCKEAAQILCAMVQSASNYALVPRPLLEWYLRHRMIDLEMANDPRAGGLTLPRDALMRQITIDIEAIRSVLG